MSLHSVPMGYREAGEDVVLAPFSALDDLTDARFDPVQPLSPPSALALASPRRQNAPTVGAFGP